MIKTERRRYDEGMTPTLPPTPAGQLWRSALDPVLSSERGRNLLSFLSQREACGAIIYPSEQNIFKAFEFCAPAEIKVVILGQDPYHGPGQAHGLSFSALDPTPIPPSLRNIYKEVSRSFGACPPNGDLSGWAKQGVFLLNALLTVEQGAPGSHAGKGWEEVTDAAIREVSNQAKGCVFMLWGAHAIKKAALIDGAKHLVLTSPHPSPLSAHRGFLGNGHFKKANEYLQGLGMEPIDWIRGAGA